MLLLTLQSVLSADISLLDNVTTVVPAGVGTKESHNRPGYSGQLCHSHPLDQDHPLQPLLLNMIVWLRVVLKLTYTCWCVDKVVYDIIQ